MARHHFRSLALLSGALALSLSCTAEDAGEAPVASAPAALSTGGEPPLPKPDLGCVIDGVHYAVGDTNPVSACQACRPAWSTTEWTDEALGTACGASHTCQAGACDGKGTCVLRPREFGALCGSDADPCVLARCDGVGACVHRLAPAGASCDDDPTDCVDQACDGKGHCLGTDRPFRTGCTDDGNLCTRDECDGFGDCLHVPMPRGTACEDDGNACTRDLCGDSGACLHEPSPGALCGDDGNPCTGANVCDARGACLHLPLLGATCFDDGNSCTTDVCGARGLCEHLLRPEGSDCGISTCEEGACRVEVSQGRLRCKDGRLQTPTWDGWWRDQGPCQDDFYDGDNVLHWTGAHWGLGTAGIPGIRTLDLSGAGDEVWLLGAPARSETKDAAHLWRWDGRAWMEIGRIRGMAARGLHYDGAAGRLYVYGSDRLQNPALFVWEDGTWSNGLRGALGPGEVSKVHTARDGTAWIVGHGSLGGFALRSGKEGWISTPVPGPGRWFVSVWAAGASDAWALDAGGKVFHWDGSGWSLWQRERLAGYSFWDLFGDAEDDLWLVGSLPSRARSRCTGTARPCTITWAAGPASTAGTSSRSSPSGPPSPAGPARPAPPSPAPPPTASTARRGRSTPVPWGSPSPAPGRRSAWCAAPARTTPGSSPSPRPTTATADDVHRE